MGASGSGSVSGSNFRWFNTQHPTPNTQHPTPNAQRRCQRKSVKWGRATASPVCVRTRTGRPPRRRHVVKGKRCQRAAGFALSAFSCREGSSSSSSSSSSSYSISEDEDEDERQPGFSFPVTPSFLRGEAARRAFSFSLQRGRRRPIPLRAFPDPLRQRLSDFQFSVFQRFSFSLQRGRRCPTRFAHSLIPCVNAFQFSAFQLFSSAGTPLPYPLTRRHPLPSILSRRGPGRRFHRRLREWRELNLLQQGHVLRLQDRNEGRPVP
jgi:hypothetical protein